MRPLFALVLVCAGCRPETKPTSNPTAPNLACTPTTTVIVENTISAEVATFEMPDQFAVRLPFANCAGLLAQLQPPQIGSGTRIDPARSAALQAELAAGKPRGIRIADRDATIVAAKDHLFVFWPRDPGQVGSPTSGGTVSGAPAARTEIEMFIGGLRAQPNICAPCDPGSPTHPDCDTTPPTGPRGGGGFRISSCSPTQCAELVPVYCPATSDGGTRDTSDCACAASCCSL